MKKRSLPKPKPKLPPLDPVQALAEAERHASSGLLKLAKIRDILLEHLRAIAIAADDMSPEQLRRIAAKGLDAQSALTGQDWRKPRNQVVRTRAGIADQRLDKNRGFDGDDYDG